MGKQATIRDVAALAGVSVATASRALNDPSYPVNAQLRQQVKEAAERLNYVPNLMARSLRRGIQRYWTGDSQYFQPVLSADHAGH